MERERHPCVDAARRITVGSSKSAPGCFVARWARTSEALLSRSDRFLTGVSGCRLTEASRLNNLLVTVYPRPAPLVRQRSNVTDEVVEEGNRVQDVSQSLDVKGSRGGSRRYQGRHLGAPSAAPRNRPDYMCATRLAELDAQSASHRLARPSGYGCTPNRVPLDRRACWSMTKTGAGTPPLEWMAPRHLDDSKGVSTT